MTDDDWLCENCWVVNEDYQEECMSCGKIPIRDEDERILG